MLKRTSSPSELKSSKLRVADLFVDLSAQVLIMNDGGFKDIEPRAWELLVHFIRNPGVLLSKEELREEVWNGVVVSDAAISQAVLRIRAVLGDVPSQPRYIETIHRRGYRFIAPLKFYDEEEYAGAQAAAMHHSPGLESAEDPAGERNVREQTTRQSMMESTLEKSTLEKSKVEKSKAEQSTPERSIHEPEVDRYQSHPSRKAAGPRKKNDQHVRLTDAGLEQAGMGAGTPDGALIAQDVQAAQQQGYQRSANHQRAAGGKLAVDHSTADIRIGREVENAHEINVRLAGRISRALASSGGLSERDLGSLQDTGSIAAAGQEYREFTADQWRDHMGREPGTPITISEADAFDSRQVRESTSKDMSDEIVVGEDAECDFPDDADANERATVVPADETLPLQAQQREGHISEDQAIEQDSTPSDIATTTQHGFDQASRPSVPPSQAEARGGGWLDTGSPGKGVFGRQTELGVLKDGWISVLGGDGDVIFIEGERGIGKSSLISAFEAWLDGASTAGYYFAKTRCVEVVGPDTAYAPIYQLFDRFCQQDASLLDIIRGSATGWLNNSKVRGNEPTTSWSTVDLYRQAITVLGEIGKRKPLVIILEDMQWCDPASLALINYLIQSQTLNNILLIGSWRANRLSSSDGGVEDLSRRLLARRFCQVIHLRGISRLEVERSIREVEPSVQIKPQLVDFVWRWTGGNPLFVKALVNHLRRRLGWAFSEDDVSRLEEVGLPTVLRDAIESNLFALGSQERAVLQACSISTETFTIETLRMLLESDEKPNGLGVIWTNEILERIVDGFIEREMLVTNAAVLNNNSDQLSTSYSFSSSLYRRIAYENVPREKRKKYHAHMANLLDMQRDTNSTKHIGEIAYHYERATDTTNATVAHQRAGDVAFQRGGLGEALQHYQTALSTWMTLPRSELRDQGELRLRVKISFVHSTMGEQYEGDANFGAAMSMVSSMDDSPVTFKLLCYLYRIVFLKGIVEGAQLLVDKICSLAELLGDAKSLMRADVVVGFDSFLAGDLSKSMDYLDRGYTRFSALTEADTYLDQDKTVFTDLVQIAPGEMTTGIARRRQNGPLGAREASAQTLELRLRGMRAWTLLFTGSGDEALAETQEMLTQARQHGSAEAVSLLLHSQLMIRHLTGDYDFVPDLLSELKSLDTMELIGFDAYIELHELWLQNFRGQSMQPGRLERAWQQYSRVRNAALYPIAGLFAMEIAYMQADADLGLQMSDSMLGFGVKHGVHWHDAEVMRMRALLLSVGMGSANEIAHVRETLERAHRLAAEQGNVLWQLRIADSVKKLGIDPG